MAHLPFVEYEDGNPMLQTVYDKAIQRFQDESEHF